MKSCTIRSVPCFAVRAIDVAGNADLSDLARISTVYKAKISGVKVRPKQPGTAKATFKVTSANAGGKTVKKTIRVKK